MDYRQEITAYFEKEKAVLDAISKDDLNELMNLLMDARDKGKNIFITPLFLYVFIVTQKDGLSMRFFGFIS